MNVASAVHPAADWSIERLRRHFGGIPAERIVLDPKPGTATEDDLVERDLRGRILCELIDGCLVEKPVGIKESAIALIIARLLGNYLEGRPLGILTGADGPIRLRSGLVREPDVGFISWQSIGADEFPDKPIADVSIDLAIEVLSVSNTAKEMARKVEEYFTHGTKLVWLVDPKQKVVDVYRSPTDKKRLSEGQTLRAPKVLPGFSIPVSKLFSGFRRPRS
ncbi:MAG: Uma2 family endonuclease [Gemmataceae bacterium]|nr:Uma2 family endonuclease [Gemmataceae bacterium]